MTTLLPINLQPICDTFVAYLTATQQQGLAPRILEQRYQEQLARLDQAMHLLTQLAGVGMEAQLAPLLSTLLQEWAIKEALERLMQSPKLRLDPTKSGEQQAFAQKLDRQYQVLCSELCLQVQQGKQQRMQDHEAQQAAQGRDWHVLSMQALERQQQQQQAWIESQQQAWIESQQQLAQQSMQQHHSTLNAAQQGQREWATVAMTGVQQAQLGVKQWYDFAATTQQHVSQMLAGTEQRQTLMVEQAVHKATTKKWATRLTLIGLVLLGMIALFGCAFFAMLHLY